MDNDWVLIFQKKIINRYLSTQQQIYVSFRIVLKIIFFAFIGIEWMNENFMNVNYENHKCSHQNLNLPNHVYFTKY